MTSVSQVIRESQVRIDLLLFEALVHNGSFNYYHIPCVLEWMDSGWVVRNKLYRDYET
jgi:hypothetical protein